MPQCPGSTPDWTRGRRWHRTLPRGTCRPETGAIVRSGLGSLRRVCVRRLPSARSRRRPGRTPCVVRIVEPSRERRLFRTCVRGMRVPGRETKAWVQGRHEGQAGRASVFRDVLPRLPVRSAPGCRRLFVERRDGGRSPVPCVLQLGTCATGVSVRGSECVQTSR